MPPQLSRLLRRLERYTHLDMVYFGSGSFWQTFGQFGSSVLALVLLYVFANFLPKETYGTYRYLISLAGLLNVLTLTGMSQAVTQAVATGKDGAFRTSVRYQAKWNSILMLVSFAVAGYYFWNGNYILMGGLLILGACVPLTNAFNTYGAYLAGKRQFRLNNIFSVLSTLVYTAGMVAVIFWSGEVVYLVAAYALTTLASTAFFYFLTVRMFKPPREKAESTLKYGRHLTFISLLEPVAGQIDSIILNHFWGPVQLATYSIAIAIPNRAAPFIKDLVDLGFPKMANKTPEEINRTFYMRIAQGMFFGLLCTVAYVLLAPYLFKYLLPNYLDALFYSQLLAITFIFSMPNRLVSVLLVSQKFSRAIFFNNTFQTMVRIALSITFGITGGILGLVLAYITYYMFTTLINIAVWQWSSTRRRV
jgi:O-antigen/teichoic acid export membrane protein